MRMLRNIMLLVLMATVAYAQELRAEKSMSGCQHFDNFYCDCSQEEDDVYCNYWEITQACPSEFCGQVESICNNYNCSFYCSYGLYDCSGRCVGCT